VGDLPLRNFLTDVKPALHVCGHVHALQPGELPTDTGGRGGTRIGYSDEVPGTVIANCGSLQAGCKTVSMRWDRNKGTRDDYVRLARALPLPSPV